MSESRPADEPLAKRALSGGLLLLGGEVVAQGCSLARNIIVVRSLTEYEYGVGAIFILVAFGLEMCTGLNMDKFLIQARDGDDRRFQGMIQLVRCLQGLLLALIILVGTPAMTTWFDLKGYGWGFAIVAAIPLLSGMVHFDVIRHQRLIGYRSVVVAEATGQVFALALIGVLCFFVHDFSLVIWGLLARVGAMMIVTHLTAERRYTWAVRRDVGVRALAFGWPLVLNGVVMFLGMKGEEFLIGSAESIHEIARSLTASGDEPFGKTDLAAYALGASLSIMAGAVVTRVSSALFLPILASLQDQKGRFEEKYRVALSSTAVLALGVGSFLVLFGTPIVVGLYSSRYANVGPIVGWLGTAHALRGLRSAPTAAAVARGDTKAPLIANMARCLSLAGVVVAVLRGWELVWIALFGVVGELLAYGALQSRLSRRHGLAPRLAAPSLIYFLAGISIAFWLSGLLPETLGAQSLAIGLVYYLVLFVAAVFGLPGFVTVLRGLRRPPSK